MSYKTIKRAGIETEYDGVVFRSRLEARWAEFFNHQGWLWQYEPRRIRGYLPDFSLIVKVNGYTKEVFCEVKPTFEIASDEIYRGFAALPDIGTLYLLVGSPDQATYVYLVTKGSKKADALFDNKLRITRSGFGENASILNWVLDKLR